MVECGVAAHPSGQMLPCVYTDGDCRHGRTEDIADDCNHRVGDHDGPEARDGKNNQSTDREKNKRQHDGAPLATRCIDRGTGWGLRHQAE